MLDAIKIKQESTNSDSLFYSPTTMERLRCLTMSRNVLLEKIKQAEAVASAEVEKAEKEHVSTTNRIPLDQEAILKEKREKAEKASQSDIDKAMKDIDKQKATILNKGKKANSKMKEDANAKISNAAGKFVDKFLESLS
jgi:vacuolar-type H+-ATPase subunit H